MAQIIEVPNFGEVEFPDDMSDDDIAKAIKKNMLGYKEPNQPKLSRTDKYLQGLKDPINAGAQLLTRALPDSVVKAGNQLNNLIADNTGLVDRLPVGGVNEQIANEEQAYQAKRIAQGESGFDGYRMVGNVINPVNLAVASKIPQGTTALRNIGIGAGTSAAIAPATIPVTDQMNDQEFWQEKGKQALVGFGSGGLLSGATSGISRVVSPKASTNPNLNILKENGVTPTIGQTLGGWANRAEEKLQSLPIMGDMISSARQGANDDFQKAAFDKALKPIGLELPKGIQGRDAVVFTENALKTQYDDVLNRIGAIKADNSFNDKLSSLQGMVNKMVAPKAEKAKFKTALNDVQQSMDDNGYITSDAFKALESSLGQDARKLGSSQNIYEGRISPAVKQLQGELRDLLKRQAGSNADDLAKANQGWASFKRAQNAATKLGADDGSFTPAQYQNAVRALDKSKDKAQFARGKALGQDLGDAGKTVLSGKVPDSGTTARAIYGVGALGSGAINPMIPASLIAGAGLYTKPAQSFLNALVSSRPELAVQAAQLIRKGGNYVTPSGGAIGLGLLNQ
jgi:hypothetical protein